MNEKPKRNGFKVIIIVLVFLILLLSIGLNYYFYTVYIKNDTNLVNKNSNNEYINGVIPEETPHNNTIDLEDSIQVDIENTTVPQNLITNSTIVDLSPETNDNNISETEIDLNELKTLIEQYAVGIERIDYQYENLESNTILLFIAKRFFDTNSSKSSLNIDTKYASTAENFHKYLSELTGKKYKNIEYINSYSNYIGYSKINKSYVLGKDSSIITDEEYVCTAIEVIDKKDDLYTAKAIIRRTANDVKTIYQVTFTFKLNTEYEYQKYQITNLNAVNSSFYPDNTVHLIAN